jgi:hypothetical protein
MVTMAVTRRRGIGPQAAAERARGRRRHPKMTIVPEGGAPFVVPYAPRETSLDGVAPQFTTADRGGREPLLLRAGDGLRQQSFDLVFGYSDPDVSIEKELHLLRALARSGSRLRVNLDHTTGSNLWRMTGFSQQVLDRQHGTNEPTRASCSITLQKASDPVIAVGPLTGGAKPAPAKPGAPAGKPQPKRTHVVARGDTLSKIALRYYGDARQYQRIADANKIRNVNRITVGQRLVIP